MQQDQQAKENLGSIMIMKPEFFGTDAQKVKQEIQKRFTTKDTIERIFFPERSNKIPDRPVITVVVTDTDYTMVNAKEAIAQIEQMTRECGTSARTFKSALVWAVAESPQVLRDEARRGSRTCHGPD